MFQKLSPELLALVLEQVRYLDARSIFIVRSVCRVFNVVATPIAYRKIALNKAIVHSDAHRRFSSAVEHISAYTNHVIIRNNLAPSGIKRILSSMARLSSITNRIHYVPDDGDNNGAKLWSVSDVLDFEQLNKDGTKVSIQNLPLGGSQNDLPQSLLDPRLTNQLVSLQLTSPKPPLTTKLERLKRLLIQCPSLETLQYEDIGRGTSFAFSAGERLPAVYSLVLKSYDWAHSADEVKQHWNLTRIRSLALVSVPLYNFVRSVCPSDLCQLSFLQVHDSLTTGAERQEDATRQLHRLVRNHIRALEVLDVTCHTRLFPIDAILQHGKSLRELYFRDHVGFGHDFDDDDDDDYKCPTLSAKDVTTLGSGLPFVHTLQLDMDYRLCSPPEFLQALTTFPALQYLTLHVQTLIQRSSETTDELGRDRDRDYESATQTFSFLVDHRDSTNPDLPWKSITINVGGWRRVMLRRVGSEWRRRNARGIFAERCFVWQRGIAGQYFVHEKSCHDGSQSLSSAQL